MLKLVAAHKLLVAAVALLGVGGVAVVKHRRRARASSPVVPDAAQAARQQDYQARADASYASTDARSAADAQAVAKDGGDSKPSGFTGGAVNDPDNVRTHPQITKQPPSLADKANRAAAGQQSNAPITPKLHPMLPRVAPPPSYGPKNRG